MTKEIHAINTRALDFVVELIEYIFEYPDDDYMTMECLCRKLVKHGLIDKVDGRYEPKDEPQTEPQYDAEEVAKDINRRVDMVKKEWNARHIEDEPQTETEIAKAIVHKMIDDAVIAEDAYPDLRQKMHDAVDEYEPQTDCAWK